MVLDFLNPLKEMVVDFVAVQKKKDGGGRTPANSRSSCPLSFHFFNLFFIYLIT